MLIIHVTIKTIVTKYKKGYSGWLHLHQITISLNKYDNVYHSTLN